ncbi:MAG: succinate dehydrogenase, cytochrome b556 subunit [Pseudomonadota bacterium]
MADVNRGNRPLSPHLSIYRLPMTAITSILNRITGVALLGGGLIVVWWLLAAASSPEYYAFADAVITSFLGDIVMTLAAWALWYHLLGGLRHLYWDTGEGLDIETAEKLSYGMIGGSVVLTLLTVIIV